MTQSPCPCRNLLDPLLIPMNELVGSWLEEADGAS